MGFIPTEMGTNTTLTNVFGGGVYFHAFYTPDLDNDYGEFYIHYYNIPKEACITLATLDWGTPSSSGLVGIEVDSRDFSGGYLRDNKWNEKMENRGIYGAKYLPLNVAIAAKHCNCETDTCGIAWKYQ